MKQKIRITKCSVPTHWYIDFIGEVFTLKSKKTDLEGYYNLTKKEDGETVFYVRQEDCELI